MTDMARPTYLFNLVQYAIASPRLASRQPEAGHARATHGEQQQITHRDKTRQDKTRQDQTRPKHEWDGSSRARLRGRET
ncbi:hypothetical protein CIB48_g11988 [Xylaria polymorpha]|nr:hypothetical protein CIB48_g11988 [Xylaria polymorpha]